MYERFFGLHDLPFRLTPDPRYLYLSPKHAEALAHLKLCPSESSGFVCITGDVGAGKTTLVRTFLAGLGPEVAVAFIVDPVLNATELLQRINQEFGIAAKGNRIELVDALHEFLLAQGRQNRVSIVVVDEAQALASDLLEQLRLLSNLETATEKLLRIVLVGQPQLRDILSDPALAQLNQRIMLRWHIGPLRGRETAAYVRHRLAVAGIDPKSALFTRSAIRWLHRLADGTPRLINMIAHRALLASCTRRHVRVRSRDVLRAYRELATVPLPRRRFGARTAWATAMVVVTVAAAALGVPVLWGRTAPPATPTVATAAAPPPAVTVAVVTDPKPDEPPQATIDDLRARLGAAGEDESRRDALNTVLAAWHEPVLDDKASMQSVDLDAVAHARGLEAVPFSGNFRLLEAFDLPAVLELQTDGSTGRRHAALTGIDGDVATLRIGGAEVVAPLAVIGRVWSGRAVVIWRDFENLGSTFGRGTAGPQVERFQRLLQRAGGAALPVTAKYDDVTDHALMDFQSRHLLSVDGLVGRLTRIALYTAAGGYRRPTLASTPTTQEARS